MKLGDDYQYPIKGSGESSYKLDSGKSLIMKEVFFVLGLKKNLLSISALDAKGMWVAFIDGQVIMWPKGNTIDVAVSDWRTRRRIIQMEGPSRTSLGP